jgi:hypothetical protein
MDELILGHMGDDDSDSKLGEVLLELKAAVNSQENIELSLRDCQQRAVFKPVLVFLMHSGDLMIAQEQFDPRGLHTRQ